MRALGACVAVVLAAAPAHAERRTVAVAPLVTTSGAEYQWIGTALAAALATRVALQPELNALTVRQLAAAMRSDDIDPATVAKPEVAARLGRLVGADLLVAGSYVAAWPTVQLSLAAIEPASGKVLSRYDLDGGLEQLVALEARAARLLAEALGAGEPNVTPGAFGTESLAAWREVTLAHSILDWQSLSPQAADARTALALPKEALQNAKRHALQATQHDPDFGEAWAALGIAQALLGESKDSWRSFGKATALGFGHHPTAIVGAAFVRMREGKFDEAAGILRGAVERRPGFLLARGYLGELHLQLGRYADALATFEAYVALTPRQPWALAQRGYAKGKLGDHLGAIADTIAAVDMVPDSPALLIQLASRYIDAGRLIGAEDALRQAIARFPGETRAYVRLGYVYLLQDKDELAIPVSEKALVQAKLRAGTRDLAYAHLNLARAYGRRGDLERAFTHLVAARDAGLASFAEIDRDPKLASLRKDPRYRAFAK